MLPLSHSLLPLLLSFYSETGSREVTQAGLELRSWDYRPVPPRPGEVVILTPTGKDFSALWDIPKWGCHCPTCLWKVEPLRGKFLSQMLL